MQRVTALQFGHADGWPVVTGSRWTAIAGYSLVGAATQLVWLNFAGVTTVAAARYGVSESAIGWLAQVFPLLYVVLAIPCGLILDRWFRAGLIAGAVLTAIGACVRLIGDDFGWLLAGQIIASIAQPLVLNAVTGITGHYLAARDRPTGIAVGTASIFFGMVIAFLLSAVFTTASSLPTMLTVTAVFCVVAALLLIVALRKQGPFELGRHRPDRGALRIAWGDPLIRRLCVLAIFPFGVFVAMSTFAQALLEPAGVSSGTASVILLVNVVAGVLGSAVIPILVVRRRAESALLVVSLELHRGRLRPARAGAGRRDGLRRHHADRAAPAPGSPDRARARGTPYRRSRRHRGRPDLDGRQPGRPAGRGRGRAARRPPVARRSW